MLKKVLLGLLFIGLLFFSFDIFAAGSLSSAGYTVDVGYIFGGGGGVLDGNGAQTLRNLVNNVVIKVLIPVGFFALFTMAIGAGFMIFSNGKDEILSKGKSIFTAGVIGLILALSAGGIMKLVIYIVY